MVKRDVVRREELEEAIAERDKVKTEGRELQVKLAEMEATLGEREKVFADLKASGEWDKFLASKDPAVDLKAKLQEQQDAIDAQREQMRKALVHQGVSELGAYNTAQVTTLLDAHAKAITADNGDVTIEWRDEQGEPTTLEDLAKSLLGREENTNLFKPDAPIRAVVEQEREEARMMETLCEDPPQSVPELAAIPEKYRDKALDGLGAEGRARLAGELGSPSAKRQKERGML